MCVYVCVACHLSYIVMSLRKRIFSMSLPSLVVVIWFSLNAMTTNAFNVDKNNVIQYHGDSRAMFGFSVAEHKEQGRSWVVIGAPEMSDSTARYDYRGGALFYCDAEQNDSCRQIPQTSYQKHSNHDKFDNNTRQWLGATIRSSGENGVILTCAPRYFWFRHNGNSQTNRDPVGTCFLSNKNFANFEEYSPCRNKNSYGHGKQGSCQVGFGAAISKDSKRIYLGAVGSYYWQGQLVSILHTHLKLPYDFEDHEILFDSQTGSAFSQTVYKPPEFMVTKEGPKTADDSWMGYSVASIEYSSESRDKLAGVVTGVPRGDQMVGKVRLLTWNLTDVRNISGEQFASYFGYSIAVADVDGDGADDIIVGAPMYSDYSANKVDIERGRVYVYYQTAKHCELADRYCWETKFANYDFIDGVNSKSRFGLAIASLGDINQDGFEDFAVGAPYEGASSECGGRTTLTGAVYIYHGSKNGVRKKFSQVISAIDMSNSLTTFGFSLSGGLDLDNNTYPDLVVGAYESGMVYLFKSRPVIQLEANITFASKNKMIGLNDNNCWLKNNAHVSCVYLDFCMMYDGVGVPDTITLDVEITLDATQSNQSPRMFFVDMEGSNQYKLPHQLYKKSMLCKKINTYIARLKPNQDKLTPLEARLTYHLVEPSFARENLLTPVLSRDDDTPLERRDSLSIKNNCGADNICKPNLVLKIDSNRTQYILGSGDLVFNVSVYNEEEDSFGTIFKMKIPPGISYSRFEDLTTQKTDLTVQCYPPKKENNCVINCDIGNPLPSNKEVRFRIILEPRTSVEEAQFDFWANVTTKNPQVSSQMRNPESSIVLPILEETQLLINSESSKSQTLYYNTSQYDHDKIENDIQAGPFVRHEYTIKNLGPSEILEANVVFDWPSQTYSGDDLLYLFAQPKTEGNIKCERVPNVNYHKLQIRRRFNERYTEPSQVSNSNHSTNSNGGYQQTITNSKWGQSGSSSVNQINSVQSGKGSTNVNQNNHHSFDSVQKNSEQNSNVGVSFHQNGQQESQNVVNQSGHRTYEEGSSFHRHEQSFNMHPSDGSSHQNSQDGYGGGGQFGVSSQRGQNNMNSVHESESSYHRSTINDNGHQNTFIDSSWRTNENGLIKNGSYSSAYPNGYDHNGAATAAASYNSENSYSGSSGASYDNHRQGSRVNYYDDTRRESNADIYNSVNAHTHQANESNYNSDINTHRNSLSFFDGQNIPIVTGDRSQMVDVNTGSRGTIIHRQRVGDEILTTYDEGIIRGQPEIVHRGTETEDFIRNKSVNVKYGRPTELPEQYEVPKSWKIMQSNLPERKKESLPLQDDQSWDTDDEETGEDDGDHDEETKGSDESRKRVRRRLIEEESSIDKNFCAMSSCTKIVCTIGRLSKDEEVSVIFPAIAWARTIKKIAFNRPVVIGSRVVVDITKLPHIKTPKLNVTYSSEILTNVTSMDYGQTPPDVVPLWIVVTSACLGTLILMLLVFLLYKSGFFKRNRPPHLPERQPLNRNGGYHMGDEQL